MRLWDFIKSEVEQFKEQIHHGETGERTWDCEPLLVLDEGGNVAFVGNTNVDVHPHNVDTADLLAHENRDGWQPSLRGASVKFYTSGVTRFGGSRDGLICEGKDSDGNIFTWYINGAAEHFSPLSNPKAKDLPPETPVEE